MPEEQLHLEFEPVAQCPLCSGVERTPRVRPVMPGGGTATLVTCAACGLVYMDPAPTPRALEQFYASTYFTPEYRALEGFAITDPVQELAATVQYMERLADDVELHRTPPGRLLDVGAAYGGFLLEMQTRGWDIKGVEPFSGAAEFCRERLGLPVVCGEVQSADLPLESFDVITLWDVLEHFAQPVDVMRRITELAAPGAVLLATSPNPDSPAALLAREQWIGWKPPTHLCLFSFHTVRRLLDSAGWQVLRAQGGGIYPGQLTVVAEKL